MKYFKTENGKLYLGNCLGIMKNIKDNSIDTIITDPPYGLKFMGKKWDYDVPSVEIWQECLRVCKPGATMLCFAGTRTQHRMAVNIEDAGWILKDCIMWLYGSGFPKATDINKNICKIFDKVNINTYVEEFICNLNNVNNVGKIYQKQLIEAGINIKKRNFVAVNAIKFTNKTIFRLLNVIIAELNLQEANLSIDANSIIVQENVEQNIKLNKFIVNNVVKNSVHQNQINQNIVQKNAIIYQCNQIMDKIKVEEVQKIDNGKNISLKDAIINVNYVAVVEILKYIILNQSKIFQNLDIILQMELRTAITVIITESTMAHLIINTVNTVKNEWEGWKSHGLKPAYEPILVAMKPNDGTYAENALKWGVSGLNINGGRIQHNEPVKKTNRQKDMGNSWDKGRFPANVILDDAAGKILDEQSGISKSSGGNGKASMGALGKNKYGKYALDVKGDNIGGLGDSGGASRFFYVAKASKSERNKGVDGIEKELGHNRFDKCSNCGGYIFQNQDRKSACKCENPVREHNKVKGNFHPTVKPIKLIEYLCKLTETPTGGVKLDPFIGSGTMGMVFEKFNYKWIGIEIDEDYCEIAKQRIKNIENKEEIKKETRKGLELFFEI